MGSGSRREAGAGAGAGGVRALMRLACLVEQVGRAFNVLTGVRLTNSPRV